MKRSKPGRKWTVERTLTVTLPLGIPVTQRPTKDRFPDLASKLSKSKRTRTNVFGSFEVDGDNFKKAEIRSSWVRFRNDYVYNP